MSETNILPPNEIIYKARELRGLSIENAAAELHLSVSVLHAIEHGHFDSLYGDAFVCGVLRSYANLLDLDASTLVRAFKDSRPVPEIIETIQLKETRFSLPNSWFRQNKMMASYGVAAVMMLAFMLGILAKSNKEISIVKTDSSIAIETAIGTTIIDVMEELPINNPTQDLLPEVKLVKPDIVSLDSYVSKEVNPSVLRQSSSVKDVSSLSFTFSADCWVEVRDGNDQKLFASIQRAQERLELKGKPPFKVTLGYAPGVILSYNSEPVSIDADNSNVAKLVLGNS